MSLPNEPDFALIKKGDGADPEVFTMICGIENVSVNKAAQTSDRYRRDCTKMGVTPVRKIKATGKALTVTGSGAANVDNIADFEAAFGQIANYEIELYKYDGTDTGALMGTYFGSFMLTTDNGTFDANADSSGDITLESDGTWSYSAAA
ncbi:hypothetical protein [Stakelama pacifica]|uniref:Phage tail tube protein n=1 Tax=Stakelama pacifica TaxID=517720 RepID=A0A4R6FKD8_9SPHN|nr:hypothetical protein [Stakelama pacifica]TDN81787.1 hypothetical protein EV664_107189 [Stakelama pacifica]GGO96568.1 hypothetical protein GCM10011329_23400 [Stakelama pacifica]